jgi:D-xylose transport system substrate-binding protein
MSRRHPPYAIQFLAATALVALSSPVSCIHAQASDTSKPVRLGLALPSQWQARWKFDAAYFSEQAAKNGDTVIVQYADGDPSKQTAQVQNMLSRGIDVLVLAPASSAVGGTIIKQAKAEGVKVIAYDIGVEGEMPDWIIKRDEEQVPSLQVEAALKFAPKGNYAVIKGDPAYDLALISDRVYARKLADAKDIKIVYNDFTKGWNAGAAQKTTEDVLTRTNDRLAAVIVNNDGMATGVVQALRGAGLNGKVFVSGLDSEPANLHLIAAGDQTMTIYTPIDVMARKAADGAHALGTGGMPESNGKLKMARGEVPQYQIAPISITRDNLCEFFKLMAPKGWADPKTVFADTDVQCP